MKKPVLILGGSTRMAVTIARSLWRHGVPVDYAALSSSSSRPYSRAIGNFVVLPSFRRAGESFLRGLFHLIERRGYDLLIPGTDSALAALAKHYDSLSDRVQLACPAPTIVDRVLDKYCILEAAKRCGVPIPATHLISRASELQSLRGRLNFPIVIKPRSVKRENEFQVSYFQSFDQLEKAIGAESRFATPLLVQEYFSGEGVGVEILLHDGAAVAVFQHRRLKELPSTGGVSVLTESEAVDPTLAQYGLELLRDLDWEGAAMVEFRVRRADGKVVLMEVNGRFWGSLFLPVRAGIDFPFYVWQLAHGEQPSVPASYPLGLRVRWTAGEVRRLQGLFTKPTGGFPPSPSAWKELARFGRDLLPPMRDALWSITDPLPAVAEVAQVMKHWTSSRIKARLRRWVPRALVELLRTYRELGKRDGRLYLKLRLLRALRIRRDGLQRPTGELRSILFVCHGNIIRSPMAAALLQRYLPEDLRQPMIITSAGLHANPERGADPRAQAVAKTFGISLDDHRARPVTAEMIKAADAVVVMDYLNEAKLLGRYPEARGKIVFLPAAPGEPGGGPEINDPYDGDTAEIRRCYEKLQLRVRQLAALLQRNAEQSVGNSAKPYPSHSPALKASREP